MEEKQYYEYEDAEKGIDYDLCACLHYNPQEGFGLPDIDKVLAVYEGIHDGPAWRWIIQIPKKRFMYLEGGCDYTGWDCQSSASSQYIKTPLDAIPLVGTLNDWARDDTIDAAKAALLDQLANGKSKTWRERKAKEFGLVG